MTGNYRGDASATRRAGRLFTTPQIARDSRQSYTILVVLPFVTDSMYDRSMFHLSLKWQSLMDWTLLDNISGSKPTSLDDHPSFPRREASFKLPRFPSVLITARIFKLTYIIKLVASLLLYFR